MSVRTRGFASMTIERRREIAKMGGIIAQATGKGHKFTSEEARAAGRKGGLLVSQNKEHMSLIGKMGGKTKRKSSVVKIAE